MRNSRFRRALLSIITGVVLGLVVMLTTNTIKVRAADEPGQYVCNVAASGGCSLDQCVDAKCHYTANQNGANCSNTPPCDWVKWSD